MPSRGPLADIFDQASSCPASNVKDELSYDRMLALADTFEGWSMDRRFGPEQSAKCLGYAEGLRRIADEVGPSWDPPEPEHLSAIGFLARQIV